MHTLVIMDLLVVAITVAVKAGKNSPIPVIDKQPEAVVELLI